MASEIARRWCPKADCTKEGNPHDGAAQVYWSAPAYDGGSSITAYRVTPYIGGTAQTPVTTSSADPEQYVTGLTTSKKQQLWNDSTTTTYFDDASVATIPAASHPGGGNHWSRSRRRS